MKRKPTKKLSEAQTDPLGKCASSLIATFKTPERLLEFLTIALTWVAEYKYPDDACDTIPKFQKCNAHYGMTEVVNFLVPAWYSGGDDPVSKLVDGLEEINNASGSEGIYDYASMLMVGYGSYSITAGFYNGSELKFRMDGIAAMLSIADALYEYDQTTESAPLSTSKA